jgi:hypothetical protein
MSSQPADPTFAPPIAVGQRVRVRQTIDRREGPWHAEVVGTVEYVRYEKTGSWFAHGQDLRLWLLRLRLRKDDGELATVVVDPRTVIEVLPPDSEEKGQGCPVR